MATTVVRPAVEICGTCYQDHDGPCDSGIGRDVTPTGAAVIIIDMNEEDPTMKNDKRARKIAGVVKRAAKESCCGKDEKCAAKDCCNTVPKKGGTATDVAREAIDLVKEVTAKLSAKETRFRQANARSKVFQDGLRAERALSDRAILEVNRLRDQLDISNTTVDIAAHDYAALLGVYGAVVKVLEQSQADYALLKARNSRLLDGIDEAHSFAREVYGSTASPPALQGKAAIAIVELGDAVKGGAL